MSDQEISDNPSQNPEDASSPETPTAAQIAELTEKAARAQQYYEQLLRTTADMDNFKKRAAREKQDAIKFANEGLLEKFIPILDNFEMALAAAGASNTTIQSLQAGVTMIHQQLRSAMADSGLEEINAGGQPFDPNLHEAISQKETAEVPDGQVVQQVRKGYKLKERLLRPASVIVAKSPAS